MHDLTRDVRYVLRTFARQPGFAAVAIATLGLGIGASTLIFSLVYSVVWQPLSYEDPERIVRLQAGGRFSKQQVLWLREQTQVYESIGAWLTRGYVARGDENSEVIYGPQVTADFFDVLGTPARLGRTFEAGEDLRGTDPVVISHGFWQSRFGGDPEVLGRMMMVTGVERRIVGVMPEGFDFRQGSAQVAVPLFMDSDETDFSSFVHLMVAGRLKPGVTIDQAQDELRRVVAGWRGELAMADDWGKDFRVIPLRESIVGDIRPALLLLLGAVGLLLLIATTNVANLLFARMLTRQRETALRLALGATRRRLLRQFLAESTMLSALGGLTGLAAASAGLSAIVALLPPEIPRLAEVTIHTPVFLFSLGMALLTGVLVGALPAFQASRADLRSAMSRATPSRSRKRLRSGLVVAETALAVVLLIGAGLLLESFRQIVRVDSGLASDDLIAMRLGRERGALSTTAVADQFYGRIEDGLLTVPGVESVAFALRIPFLEGSWSDDLHRLGESPETASQAYWRPVSPEYFSTLGIRLLRGRGFEITDHPDGNQVAVLNETAARHLFPEGNALGQRVQMPWEERAEGFLVVGVVADVKLDGLHQPSPLIVYRPFAQVHALLEPIGATWRQIFLRTTLPPEDLFPLVQEVPHAVNPNAAIGTFQPMTTLIDDTLAEKRALTWVLALFAATALVLGAVGIYGVIAYTVSERTKEMGIRLALGSTGARLIRRVVGDGLKTTLLGIVAGFILAGFLTRFLASEVFGVSPLEPAVFGAVAVVLAIVAAGAALGPALQASRVDPIEVLKDE